MEVYFFANIPNFIVEKDYEIKIGCYWGSGGDLFFLGFRKKFLEAKMGVPPFLLQSFVHKIEFTDH